MRPLRYLAGVNSSAISDTEELQRYDSDFVIILAALLCALICVLGLIAVARCAWLRRLAGDRGGGGGASTRPRPPPPPPTSNKGLKKKILKSLPKYTFTAEYFSARFSDCAICLAEFDVGDEIRVLPPCGHGFHVSCIDAWFRSHSSCPSCRQILVVSQCQKCGGLPASSSTNGGGSESRAKEEGEDKRNRFLP